MVSVQGRFNSREYGEQLLHGKEEQVGYIPDRKAGLKRCIRTRPCLPCGKMTSLFNGDILLHLSDAWARPDNSKHSLEKSYFTD